MNPTIKPFTTRSATSVVLKSNTAFNATVTTGTPTVKDGCVVYPEQAGGGILAFEKAMLIHQVLGTGFTINLKLLPGHAAETSVAMTAADLKGARLPAGSRLEFTGGTQAIVIAQETQEG